MVAIFPSKMRANKTRLNLTQQGDFGNPRTRGCPVVLDSLPFYLFLQDVKPPLSVNTRAILLSMKYPEYLFKLDDEQREAADAALQIHIDKLSDDEIYGYMMFCGDPIKGDCMLRDWWHREAKTAKSPGQRDFLKNAGRGPMLKAFFLHVLARKVTGR